MAGRNFFLSQANVLPLTHTLSCQQKRAWSPKERRCSDLGLPGPQNESGQRFGTTRSLVWVKDCRNKPMLVQKVQRAILSLFGISF